MLLQRYYAHGAKSDLRIKRTRGHLESVSEVGLGQGAISLRYL